MAFDHNAHYHRTLLRRLPRHSKTALDVGCGLGGFARRLAERGVDVDAVDPSERTIEAARSLTPDDSSQGTIHYLTADATTLDLEPGRYDFICCLASLHHMPFDTLARLRQALAPGGTLAILGLYDEQTIGDWAISLTAVPVNALARLALAGRSGPDIAVAVQPGGMTLAEIAHQSSELLPGRSIRRLLFWRYLLVYREGTT